VGILEILQQFYARFMLDFLCLVELLDVEYRYLTCLCYYITENAKINTR